MRLAIPLLTLLTGAAFAAGYDPSPALDPVNAAPQIYALKLENEYVRAIETRARPGELTPMHSHPGRAVVFLDDCVDRRVNDAGEIGETAYAEGDVVWAPAQTHGDYRYTFTEECRLIEIEVKAAAE